jgi:hypothetical protein
MPWLVETPEICKPHVHKVAGALQGITLIHRQCGNVVRTSPFRRSRDHVRGRVSSQNDAALQEMPSKRGHTCLPCVEEALKVCRRASKS